MKSEEKDEMLESVKRYNLDEYRAELARLLAKITGRKITGKVEIDLNQGTPGAIRSREVVKKTE
jgi:hypothetical protein